MLMIALTIRRCQIGALWMKDVRTTCGYVMPTTKVVLRTFLTHPHTPGSFSFGQRCVEHIHSTQSGNVVIQRAGRFVFRKSYEVSFAVVAGCLTGWLSLLLLCWINMFTVAHFRNENVIMIRPSCFSPASIFLVRSANSRRTVFNSVHSGCTFVGFGHPFWRSTIFQLCIMKVEID